MRIDQEIIKEGVFWLEGQEDADLQGVITIKENEPIILQLNGSFNIKGSVFGRPHVGRVLGRIEKYGFVTLDGCFYIRQSFDYNSYDKSTLHVNSAYLGIAMKGNDDLQLNSLTFSCDSLDSWVGITGIKFDHVPKDGYYNLSYKKPDDISIEIGEGLSLSICFGASLPGVPIITEAGFKSRAYIRISSIDKSGFEELDKIAHKIVAFLSIAVGKQLVISDVVGSINGESSKVSVYYQSNKYTIANDLKNKDMIFKFSFVKGRFEEFIKNWLSFYDIALPAISLYFSSINKQHGLIEGRFISLVQGLETYHRTISTEKVMTEDEFAKLTKEILDSCPKEHRSWLEGRVRTGNEISLVKRIKRMIEPFKDYIGTSALVGKLSNKITTTRNYLTHYNSTYEAQSAKGLELYKLIMFMECLFMLHFLKAMGMTDDDISAIMKINFSPLKDNLDYSIDR
ncbi:HEPN domain-containing protein [Pantoea agglomerans]|uniref:ApeA N-terminal domain 1-containing protein n=1 Tax=Enterobacter agglomerans TaxID=549 RepID=UPI003C7E4AD6